METTNPMIIELAIAGHRTELLDVYLSANCYFCLTNGTGIDGISRIFRRPIVMVNHVPLEYLIGWGTNMISIEKKYWLKDEHRFMSFKEILKSGVGRYLQTQKFDAHGIELIENTAEEIRDVAIEMDERLKGTWVTSDEDEELQRRFWTIFKSFSSGDLNKVYRARIGANYLRQNRELLD
jgi:putative glycosyltransferase (TIGR04372 family)